MKRVGLSSSRLLLAVAIAVIAGSSLNVSADDDTTKKKDDKSSSTPAPSVAAAGSKSIQCTNSVTIDGKTYDCKDTEDHINQANFANAMGQAVGATTVGVNGAVQANNAAKAGTMSANVKAASINTNLAGTLQTVQGAMNLYYGYQQYQDMNRHKDNAQELQNFTKDASASDTTAIEAKGASQVDKGVYGKTYTKLDKEGYTAGQSLMSLNDPFQSLKARHDIISAQDKLATGAVTEQSDAAHAAKLGATNSIFAGTIQTVQGMMMMKLAKEQRDAANAIAGTEQTNGATFGSGFGQDTLGAPGGTGGLTGNGFNSHDNSAANAANPTPGGGGLGNPFNTDKPPGDPNGAPAAPKFAEGAPKDTPAGGSAGLNSGGALPAATPDNTDTSPKMADYKSMGGYDSGSGGMMGGRGSSGGGPDLAGLFGQLFGKTQDPKANGGGIMSYGNGRNPASENYGLLDKNVNIFDRVHDAYQNKQKQNFVGI